jgi:uncharacterized membrane protein YdjX (TVP38/TMEM64 family)
MALLGLVDALFMAFVLGISLANMLVNISSLDMMTELGALTLAFAYLFIVVYLLNFFYSMDRWLFWKKKWGKILILILCPIGLIFANHLKWDDMTIVPAALLRDGLHLDTSLTTLNISMVVFVLVGLLAHFFSQVDFNRERKRLTRSKRMQLNVLIAVSFVFFLFYFVQPGVQYFINDSTSMLASADISKFKDYLLSFGALAPVISAALMILQAVVAPLPAFVITFANGMLFGAFWGSLLSWSSAMLGAALCYFIARMLGRPIVERLVSKTAVEWVDKFFVRYGKHSVLLARLLPFISFDLVSYGAGLTSMNFWSFFVATGIGQAPATVLYSYLGQTASGSVKLLFWVFIVMICLGIFIAAWKKRSAFQRVSEK